VRPAKGELAKLRRQFIRASYLFQGLINLVFALFFVRLDVSPGGSGGGITGLEIVVKSFLVFVSGLSFLTALILIFRGESSAKYWATMTSFFYILFYEATTIFAFAGVALGNYSLFITALIIGVAILFLNVTSLYFLHKILRNPAGQRQPPHRIVAG